MDPWVFSCERLQRFVERQWLRLQRILSLKTSTSPSMRYLGGPQAEALLGDDSDHAEEMAPVARNRKSLIWTGSADVINEETNIADIVSVIDNTCETLTNLLDAGHGYKRHYVVLLEALVKLLNILKDVERQQLEMLRTTGIFGQLKVSLSITYALIEKVSARPSLLILVFKLRPLTCTSKDTVPNKLKHQAIETRQLLKQVVRALEIFYQKYNSFQSTATVEGSSHSTPLYGVNKLTIAAHHHRSLLIKGEKVSFFVCDPDIRVVYIVQTWLNNPKSFFHTAKRLSASVECSSGKVYNISVPGYPNKEADVRHRTALIVSAFERAQVKSLLPLEELDISGFRTRNRAALLQQDQSSSGDQQFVESRQKYAGEFLTHSRPKAQIYRGEIEMSSMVLNLDCTGQTHEVRKLSLEGKKHKNTVWYKCCVEVTGEVLAIYRQKRRGRVAGRREEGVFHILGLGNHPELRDLIICSFVAMGVNSYF